MNGVCVGINDPIMCTDGTVLNDEMTGCVIDPDACQDGTVLVGNECVDPGHLPESITEGAEPNGLGLFGEASAPEGAGTIVVPAVAGAPFVIKGTIVPFQDLNGGPPDPLTGLPTGDGQLDIDVDSYILEVPGPVLLNVSADGLHGLAAGFIALNDGSVAELVDWVRFGINVNADTSKRQLFIPAAGRYVLAVADTRSLFLTGAAAGAEPDALPFEYYVSITQLAIAPQAITITDNSGIASGELQPGEVEFFSAPLGEGINDIEYDATAEQLIESLVITNTSGGVTSFKAVADGDVGETTAFASVLGIRANDTTLIVADHVFNYANQAIAFDVTVTTRNAGALSTDGGTATLPTTQGPFETFDDLSAFYYDVATDGEITGMNISFNQPVAGVIVDENFFIFSFFTFDPAFGFFFEETFQSYNGLLRHPTAGRYYFLVFVPGDVAAPAPEIIATSTYAPVVPVAVTKGTPTGDQTPTVFESNPFTYAAGVAADNWQQFNATGTASGTITLTYFNPSVTDPNAPGFGFGRLDPLVSECGAFCDDVNPLFTTTHNPNGSQPRGRILLDDGTDTYLLTANTQTVAGATFSLDFERREHDDLGTIAAGSEVTRTNVDLDTATTIQRYIVKTTAGNGLNIAVAPTNTDTRIQRLNNDESPRGGNVSTGGLNQTDSVQVIQSGEGWTAFQVTALVPIVDAEFDLTVAALAPVTYTAAASATAFDDACVGGTLVALQNGDEGASLANINTPAGFDFFGFPASQVKVFANGFMTVDTSLVCPGVGFNCFFTNQNIPNVGNPNGMIAPYWDDIDVTIGSVCQKTVGTKLIVQWQGETFIGAIPVSFQAIIDGSDNSIEFVYDVAANHAVDGTSATSGIENQVGSAGNAVTFNAPIAAGTSVKLTQN